MTLQEKFERIAPYIPYEVQVKFEYKDPYGKDSGECICPLDGVNRLQENYYVQPRFTEQQYLENVTPILRPFDHLSLPLQYEGKNIFPAEHIAQVATGEVDTKFNITRITGGGFFVHNNDWHVSIFSFEDFYEATEVCIDVDRRIDDVEQFGAHPVHGIGSILRMLYSLHFAVGFSKDAYLKLGEEL